ncbi:MULTISPECIES: DMT family transporter [unclassified Vibrio]|uniref:DMT family transporter n=1 Tax=Vibrio sp. HB236076 TaxID=3232307 RepID=A0AB39HCM5_9VIBR|nr:DMT family transporter [Vibrio sp. HB161653]MDP5255238.1 DMT family transporter [Vibrio sp. HB161653]
MFKSVRAEWILVATTVLAAAGWIFSKQAIEGLPPIGFIGIRFVLAAVCLLPFCYRALKLASARDCLTSMAVGLVLSSAIFCWIYAISLSETLGEGAFIMSLAMLVVPLLAWPLFGQRPPRAFWLALPIAIAGLFLLSWHGEWVVSSSQIWFLAATVLLALHFNINSRYSLRLPPILLTTLQLFSGGCFGLVLSSFFEVWPDSVPWITWQWVALSIVLATSIRYLVQTIGQKYCQPTNAALIMLLEPIFTLILSIVIYQEQLTLNKTLGCGLVLLSILFYRLVSLKRR